MEVEQMNHMSNDQIRKRVKNAKDSFERVRKDLRKVQNAKAASEIGARKKDQYEIVSIFYFLTSPFLDKGDGRFAKQGGTSHTGEQPPSRLGKSCRLGM
jgi:hypothetical protein